MTHAEAIKQLSNVTIYHQVKCTREALDMAIEALEKQEPKKPRETRCALMCARCGHKITEKGCKKLDRNYCKKCGQAIDWSDDE